MSPSHTVGLELKKDNTDPLEPDDYVTIPHGGLGTPYEKRQMIEFNDYASPSHTVGLERSSS